MKTLAKKRILQCALFVRNFSNKHHDNLPKFLRIFSFWYFCPKEIFRKLFVLKVDVLLTSSSIFLNNDCSCFEIFHMSASDSLKTV